MTILAYRYYKNNGFIESKGFFPMKKLLTRKNSDTSRESAWITGFVFVICTVLGFTFWTSMTPTAKAREMTPKELIESQLPAPQTLAKASKFQVLSAICAAVKRFRKDAPQILEATITARKEFATDAVKSVIHCLEKPDCNLIQDLVNAAITANPEAASEIADAALDVTPSCADAIQLAGIKPPGEGPNEANQTDGPTNQNPPPGSVAGGGVDPQEATTLICDNGTQVNVAASRVESYLQNHQGAFVGNCQLTPDTNR